MARRKLQLDGLETCGSSCKWMTIWFGTKITKGLYWRDYKSAQKYRDNQMKLGYVVHILAI